MIFVNSMSDLFHKDVPDEYIIKVARVMTAANWHTYQVLTKRADRLAALLKGKLRFAAEQAHIWWGGSAWRTSSTACRELICCAPRLLKCDFYPLNRYWKPSAHLTWTASLGRLLAAKAVRAHVR